MTPSSPEPSKPSLSDQVDLVCDQFEAAAQAGKWWRIEDVIAEFSASGRSTLLIELLAIEIDLRRRRGETVDFAVYRKRFPEAFPILEELVVEARRDPRKRSDINPFTGPVDPNAETIALPNAPRRWV